MLKKPDVNVSAICELAAFIETLEPAPLSGIAAYRTGKPGPFKFNMGTVISDLDCGTVGCICGAGMQLFNIGAGEVGPYLGLKNRDENRLFYPYWTGDHNGETLPFSSERARCYLATPQEAAKVLRNLAVTGEVDWSIIL